MKITSLRFMTDMHEAQNENKEQKEGILIQRLVMALGSNVTSPYRRHSSRR